MKWFLNYTKKEMKNSRDFEANYSYLPNYISLRGKIEYHIHSIRYHAVRTKPRCVLFQRKAAVKAQKSVSESGEAVYLVRPMRALEALHTCAHSVERRTASLR